VLADAMRGIENMGEEGITQRAFSSIMANPSFSDRRE
jgi:hypothetical protein